jgi:hypothetical protein
MSMRRVLIIAATTAALVLCFVAAASAATPWTIAAASAPLESFLTGVSCTSAASCTAVGATPDNSGGQQPLAEYWNGTSWAVQVTPAGDGADYLTGISCTSATSCVALGTEPVGITNHPFAETWNGSTWTTQPVPSPSGSFSTLLSGISCASASDCTAVGYSEVLTGGTHDNTLAEHWDGSTWSIQPTPNSTSLNNLIAVSCPTAANCTAVGQGGGGPGSLAVEHWNGSTWTLRPARLPQGEAGQLNSIFCAGAFSCIAVGEASTGSGAPAPLAEHWNGATWTVQAMPSQPAAASSTVLGVSCTSPASCTAVGYYLTKNNTFVALAEVLYRGTWRLQATATPVAPKALDGVSCTSVGTCAAVGYVVGNAQKALIEQK